MEIFETHAHYDDEAFDTDRNEVLSAINAGTYNENEPVPVGRIVNCGASLKSSERSVQLAEKYDFVYAAVGVHPDEIGELAGLGKADDKSGVSDASDKSRFVSGIDADARDIGPGDGCDGFERLRQLAGNPKVVAIGEIGLDYHWDVWPRELQREMFIRQWELAIELNLPIEVHSRDAAEDTFSVVKEMYEREKAAGRSLRADMHCYSYSVDQAREYARMGFYFGVGGVVTFKNARKTHELVREIPLERILLETDCPYLAPEPYRGQRNNSALIYHVAEKIAELRGITAEEVCRVTYENACRFFGRTDF